MSENTKTKDQKPKTKDRIFWLFFALIIIFIYFFGLNIPLLGPDEPRYSQIAREMLERGDWITPKLGGFDWFEKPALLYWLQIFFYKIFGVNEFAARFGSALFGLGTILSLWILGRNYPQIDTNKHESEDQRPKTDFANYLALIAASSIGLIAFSRGASFDIILTFPITAALAAFYIWERQNPKSKIQNPKSLIVFYFFIGVSLLAKGLVGIVFPFAIVAFYYVLSRKLPNKTFILSLFWGTILSLSVAAVWYAPMYRANGWKFVDEFFIQHHFQRFTSDKYQHHQPFWFFFVVLPLMTLPWLPFFFAEMWRLGAIWTTNLKSRFFDSKSSHSDTDQQVFGAASIERPPVGRRRAAAPLLVFSFAWFTVPLVFFSLSGSKLPGYILPALPGALVLTTAGAYRFIGDSARRAMFIKAAATLFLFGVIAALNFFAADYTKSETVKNLIAAADAQGFGGEQIVSLYAVSHNLEFYAAGRLPREPDGKLKRYDDFSVLVKELGGGRILVVVPQKDVAHLQQETGIAELTVIATNGETAIIEVRAK